MHYVIPVVVDWPGTIIAVNVGGAVIPGLLSLYLLIRNELWIRGLLATAGVTVVCHMLAQPVAGVGIALPVFVPPASAAIVALLLSRRYAAPLAYIGGSMGTLIGADLLNLDKVQGLGAPVVSIGGAGTFDGIFLTGILAVLLASMFSQPVRLRMGTPRFIVCRRPTAEPRAQQWCGLGGLPGAQTSDDQRVFENLALRVTAADPRQVGECRFEDLRSLGIVAVAERRYTCAQSGCHLARRQAAVTGQALQPVDAGLQTVVVAGRGLGKSDVDIGKAETGMREMPPRMGGHLGPFLVESRTHVVEPPPPQKRCRVSEHQHRRRPRHRRPDIVEVDRASALGIAAGQLE